MVLPVSALVLRRLKDTEIQDRTLFSLREELFNGADSNAIMKSGLALGDRAAHFAAGFRGSRNLHKTMPTEKERMMYGRNMAQLGYSSALKAAEYKRGKSTDARNLLDQVRPLAENLDPVISILGALRSDGKKAEKGLILSANGIN